LAQAARLLGAQVMLTGIRPEVARTLIGLGVDLGGIETHGPLQAGIAAALRRRGA
jgi:rsbT co-antagonist protein RsbR